MKKILLVFLIFALGGVGFLLYGRSAKLDIHQSTPEEVIQSLYNNFTRLSEDDIRAMYVEESDINYAQYKNYIKGDNTSRYKVDRITKVDDVGDYGTYLVQYSKYYNNTSESRPFLDLLFLVQENDKWYILPDYTFITSDYRDEVLRNLNENNSYILQRHQEIGLLQQEFDQRFMDEMRHNMEMFNSMQLQHQNQFDQMNRDMGLPGY